MRRLLPLLLLLAAGLGAGAAGWLGRAAPRPLPVTRFTIPVGEGQLVRNTGFMTAVTAAPSPMVSAPHSAVPSAAAPTQKQMLVAPTSFSAWVTVIVHVPLLVTHW